MATGKEFIILLLIIKNTYGMSRDEERLQNDFVKRKGLPRQDVSYIQRKIIELDNLVAESLGVNPHVLGEAVGITAPKYNIHDVPLYTRPQMDFLVNLIKTEPKVSDVRGSKRPPMNKKPSKRNKKPKGRRKLKGRGKRKITDFVQFPAEKWNLPISFKIGDDIGSAEERRITEAIADWEENTCIKFKKITDVHANISEPHLKFVKFGPNEGDLICGSYTGRVPESDLECVRCISCNCPQLLFIGRCTVTGNLIHEIGHAIGLIHEQSRADRNRFVKVHGKNIRKGSFFQFIRRRYTRSLLVPYDFGSVMQYPPFGFSKNGHPTITTDDPMHQMTLGQRVGVSFYDVKIVNKDYCRGMCKPLPCKRGGFVNPNNCSKCICPDGFDGTICQEVAKSSPSCPENPNSKIILNDRSRKCINYSPKSGNVFKCYLLIQTHANWKIEIFNVTTNLSSCGSNSHCCQNWLETKHQNNLESTGPRFCGSRSVHKTMVSDSNEVMLILKNNVANSKKNFTLCFNAVG